MPTTITDSSNIALLDSKILADLCTGVFEIDISPSVFIGGAVGNILGASVQVKNITNGTTVKNYPVSGSYDILPPFTDKVVLNVPTIAGSYQYGKYMFDVKLFDEDGRVYEISKQKDFCAPDNQRKKYGTLSATLDASCLEGRLHVKADSTPVYGGVLASGQVNEFTLEYPTHSTLPVLSSTVTNFNVLLFEGVYIFKGESCASYSLGDNIFAKVKYKYKREKSVFCRLNEECISSALVELLSNFNAACSLKEKSEIMETVMRTLLLVQGIKSVTQSGFDPSDLIAELEEVLGCVCTCNCDDGAPYSGLTPASDVIINGCGIDVEVTGLTHTYTFPNWLSAITVEDNGGVLIAQGVVDEDCVVTQKLVLNISALYGKIKGLASATYAESIFWATITNKQWDGFDATCLGYTTSEWAAMTFRERSAALLAGACSGGICNAKISGNTASASGSGVIISWVNNSGVYENAIYIDSVLVGTVLNQGSIGEFLAPNFADGNKHTYTIVSKCKNGSIGQTLTGSFTLIGCPTIAPPTVSNVNVSASCPYDLTGLVSVLPSNTTAEWHNQNNTSVSSLVANASQVSAGTYYVFAKDTNGCYSLGVKVTLTCTTGNCTAPQGLIVEEITGGARVRFSSSAYPPPSNSYTVKRRLASSPDVAGSYTTIGTPTYNGGASRWEILDNTRAANTLYVYRAISNCGSTAPYIDYTHANITCAPITTTVVTT